MAQHLLSKCFLFRELEPAQLASLSAIAADAHFGKGEPIFAAGSEGSAMYLIAHGSVLVEKEGQEIARLGSGSHFGELALLDGQPRSASVTSLEKSGLIVLPREAFQKVVDSDPVLAARVYRAFCKYLAARLRRSNEQTVFFRELAEQR